MFYSEQFPIRNQHFIITKKTRHVFILKIDFNQVSRLSAMRKIDSGEQNKKVEELRGSSYGIYLQFVSKKNPKLTKIAQLLVH